MREIDEALRSGRSLPLDVDRLLHLNERVLRGIPDRPEVVPGALRQHDVGVGRYRAPAWDALPGLVDRLVTWVGELRRTADDARPPDRFVAAVLAAVLAHLYLAWIHPFGNGNGRVARLVEVQMLSESGVVPLVATNLLSDYYNKTRERYYLELGRAQQDPLHFVRYAVQGFVDELREQIAELRRQSLSVHWESYVYEVFDRQPNTVARKRQRLVALSVPAGQEVSPEDLPDLTVPLARLYATTGPRTPARDLNDLVKAGLAERTSHRRYRVRREQIEAFLPPVATLPPTNDGPR